MLLAGKPAVHTVHPQASISLRSLSTLLNSPFSLSLPRNCINGSPSFSLSTSCCFSLQSLRSFSAFHPTQHSCIVTGVSVGVSTPLVDDHYLHLSKRKKQHFLPSFGSFLVPFSSFVFIVYASLLHAVIPRAFSPLGKEHGRRARLFVHCLFLASKFVPVLDPSKIKSPYSSFFVSHCTS